MNDPASVEMQMELLNQILRHIEQLYWLMIVQLTLSFVVGYVVIPRRSKGEMENWRIGESTK